jgi:hypothetical protein
MISRECRFSEFVGAVRDKDYFEVIQLAEREATAAERLLLRVRTDEAHKARCGRDYARRIKRLIDYMRYEVKPRARSGRDEEIFAAFGRERRLRRGI